MVHGFLAPWAHMPRQSPSNSKILKYLRGTELNYHFFSLNIDKPLLQASDFLGTITMTKAQFILIEEKADYQTSFTWLSGISPQHSVGHTHTHTHATYAVHSSHKSYLHFLCLAPVPCCSKLQAFAYVISSTNTVIPTSLRNPLLSLKSQFRCYLLQAAICSKLLLLSPALQMTTLFHDP